MVLIVHKVTVHKCSKSPPPESIHAWTSLIMDYHILSKFPERLRKVWQTSKYISAICLQSQMELNTLRSLSVSTDKIRKNWAIFFADNFYVNFSLVWGLTSTDRSSILHAPCILCCPLKTYNFIPFYAVILHVQLIFY